MLKKRLFFPVSIFVFVFISTSCARCSEAYYIDNNRVLLYKIINWWYECLPDEANALCGRLIKYEKQKDIIIKYDQNKLNIVLTAKGGFATQISATDLKCTWSNRAYFGGGKPVDITSLQLSAGEFTINNIDANHYHRIKDILPHLTFELKGEIAGLLNGQIALHRAGPFIKKCPLPPKDSGESSTTSFRIINFHTKEVLATYSPVFEH